MKSVEDYSAERKKSIEQGHTPEWFTTPGYQMFCTKFFKDKTIRDRISEIAETCCKHTNDPVKYYKIFFNLLWSGKLAPSTPVWANLGNHKGMPVSCTGNYVSDSVGSFYESLTEAAVLSKLGFGTSSYLGDIRHRGAEISRGGNASGVMPVIKNFIQMARDISQGGTRKGAWAGYLPIEHDDFYEVVEYLKKSPEDFNFGWNVSNDFINRLNDGDSDAELRLSKALHTKLLTGKGYFHFIDRVNEQNPIDYKVNGMTVEGSNLCVTPDTLLLTDKGNLPIGTLKDKDVNAWNGDRWSKVTVRQTGVNQKVITVKINGANDITCTPEHKFYVSNNYSSKVVEVKAKDLQPGDRLENFNSPCISNGNKVLFKAYTNGFFTGDGCQHKGKSIIYLYDKKVSLKSFIEHEGSRGNITVNDRDVGGIRANNVKGLMPKFFVPDATYTIKSRLDWLAGYADADGCIYRNGDSEQLVIGSVNLECLNKVKYLLLELGIKSKITRMFDERDVLLPKNDRTGEYDYFYCKASYRLIVGGMGLYELGRLGIKFNRLEVTFRKPQRCANRKYMVEDVIDNGEISDTYCATEPFNHKLVFNGVLTGNCNEISLASDAYNSFSCILSSINLLHWDDITDEDIRDMHLFLDCICSEFLKSVKESEDSQYLRKVINYTEKFRSLGLGTLGYHSYLQSKLIPFDSLEALSINNKIFDRINRVVNENNYALGLEYGVSEGCKTTGNRNSHVTAIAPNTTSAILCGSVSQGIEPIYANAFIQNLSCGEVIRVNPELIKVMKSKGVYNQTTINDILHNDGSVQHVSWLSDELKEVFKTAFEQNQFRIIAAANNRQMFLDQSQSLNLYIPGDADEEFVMNVHKHAFTRSHLKGLYYLRSNSTVKASACTDCES